MKRYLFKYSYYGGLIGDKSHEERTEELEAENDEISGQKTKKRWEEIKTEAAKLEGGKEHKDSFHFISLTEVRRLDVMLDTIHCSSL